MLITSALPPPECFGKYVVQAMVYFEKLYVLDVNTFLWISSSSAHTSLLAFFSI